MGGFNLEILVLSWKLLSKYGLFQLRHSEIAIHKTSQNIRSWQKILSSLAVPSELLESSSSTILSMSMSGMSPSLLANGMAVDRSCDSSISAGGTIADPMSM